jgi:malonyl-CoA O-methyltransferase
VFALVGEGPGVRAVFNALRKLRRWARQPRVLTSRAAYHLWAAAYPPHAHNPFMVLEESLMLAHLPPVRGLTILDLACGTGRYTRLLMQQGAHVISIDHSFDMLARGIAPQAAQADITALPLPSASLDGIVCGLAIGHVANLQKAVSEIGRVLRPSGFALLSDLHPALKEQNAQRTFNAQGQTFAIEHYWHTEDDYQQAARAADLHLIAQHAAALPQRLDAPLVTLIQLHKED